METLNHAEINELLATIKGIDAPLPIISWTSKGGGSRTVLLLSPEQKELIDSWNRKIWKYHNSVEWGDLEVFRFVSIDATGKLEGWETTGANLYAYEISPLVRDGKATITMEDVRTEWKRVRKEQEAYTLTVTVS